MGCRVSTTKSLRYKKGTTPCIVAPLNLAKNILLATAAKYTFPGMMRNQVLH